MAGTLLAGRDMAAGNWRLCGWWLPSDSYVTLDVPLYAVLSWLGDAPSRAMLHAGAIIWGVVGTLGLAMARTAGARLAVLAMLAVPITFLGGPVHMLSESPMHVSMVAAVLLAFWCAAAWIESPERPWPVVACGCVLLLAVIGDPLALVVGGLPILAASGLCLRAGANRRPHLLALAVTAAAMLAGPALVAFNARHGGFQPSAVPRSLTEWHRIGPDLAHVAGWICQFLGAAPGPARDGVTHSWFAHPARAIMLVRWPLAAMWAAGVVTICARVVRGFSQRTGAMPAYLDLLLGLSVLADIAATVASGIIFDEVSARYVLPAFVCGAVLSARLCGSGRMVRAYLAVTLAISGAVELRAVLAGPWAPVPAKPAVMELARVLGQAGLHDGFAPYYSASILTAVSDGAIRSRAVWVGPDGKLAAFPWLASAAWFGPGAWQADRVFFVVPDKPDDDGFAEAAVLALMGAPAQRLRTGSATIDVYPAASAGLRQLCLPRPAACGG